MKRFLLLIIAAFVFVGIGFAPQEKAAKKAPAAQAAKTADVYSCPMHPDVKSDKPGECPKCKMSLEKSSMKEESGKKECSGCCCKCCAKGGKTSGMKMQCPSDSAHAGHGKMMKECGSK